MKEAEELSTATELYYAQPLDVTKIQIFTKPFKNSNQNYLSNIG